MRTLELTTDSADRCCRVARLGDLLPGVLARYGLAPISSETPAGKQRTTVTVPHDAGRRRLEPPRRVELLRRPA